MYKETNAASWKQYLETTRRGGAPVKLDRLLKRRMRTFIKARQAMLNQQP